MPEFDKIDVSEGIDVNKTNPSKEYDICHYWYFLDKGFKFEPYPCKGCHDLIQKAMNVNDVAIVSVNGSDYRIHFWYMSKDDAINIMKNFDLNRKMGDVTTYYQKNKEKLLNRAKEYYENNKGRLREQARNKYK